MSAYSTLRGCIYNDSSSRHIGTKVHIQVLYLIIRFAVMSAFRHINQSRFVSVVALSGAF
jgi:hypothetical protein